MLKIDYKTGLMTTKNDLTAALKKYFGFDTFKGNQEAIIKNLLDGNDTFVLMPTGGGKSLCYQLPSLLSEGTAVVISPLIALMKNQVDAMRNFSEEDGVAHFINSSLNKASIDQVKEDILSGKTKLLYVAPESLTKEENIEFLKNVKISFYAVDEAHCISEWGHDFRPEYRRIRPIINEIGTRPVIALTATATPKVQHDIQKNLGMTDAAVFKSSFNRPNLYYEVRPKTQNVDKDIIKYIKSQPGKSGIIYCLSRKKVEELAETLKVNGINALPYHAGMDSNTRTRNQDAFLLEEVDVIVATIAFGMGIDKPDVRLVVHLDMPSSPEEYYQEAGRAGRDGETAYAVMLYSPADKAKLHKRVADMFPEKAFIVRIYEALCNYMQIAEGSGQNTVRDFDLTLFCHTFKFPILPTYHALKIVEQSGYIEYVEEADSQSRVMVTVQRDELYRLKIDDSDTDTVLQCLLRSYTGLFADYIFIKESLLERRTGLPAQTIYESLIYLGKLHIIHYIPRKRMPFIYFTRPRTDLKYFVIPRTAYEERKERFSYRIERILQYALCDNVCRERLLLEYFGEKNGDDCGGCDVCMAKKNSSLSPSLFDQIVGAVKNLLQAAPLRLNDIVERLPYPEERIIETVRYLVDEGFIHEENLFFYWGRK